MNRRQQAVAVIVLAVAAIAAACIPAGASTCTRVRPVDVSVIGGQEITTMVVAEKCGATITVIAIESATSGKPYRITSAELWRYTKPLSQGAVRSAKLGGSPTAKGHRVRAWVSVPARERGQGWAGLVRATLRAGGETRVVALML